MHRIDAHGSSDAATLARHTYPTREAAAEALRVACWWAEVHLSAPYDTEAGEAVSAYPSDEERDRDVDGAHYPAIVRVRYDFGEEMRAARAALSRRHRDADLVSLLRQADREDPERKGREAVRTIDDLIGRYVDGAFRGGARLFAAWSAAGKPSE